MKTSESIVKISAALLKAQKTMGGAVKGSTNPYFKSKYADLGAVMAACKDALNENGITVLQPIGTDEYGVYVETVLLHESGEFIADKMKIAPKTDSNPQDQGSAISYARRYSLQSMVFIPAEDDDAEKATNHTKVPTTDEVIASQKEHFCSVHQKEMKLRQTQDGQLYDHRLQIDGVWNVCYGKKWIPNSYKPEVIPERQINDY